MVDFKKRASGIHNLRSDADFSGLVSYPEVSDSVSSESPIVDMIFAPDPITGVPRSDLAFMLSADRAPEVRQFIQDTLMRSNGVSRGVDDADLAIEGIKDRRETFEQYANRLREMCQSELK